MTDATDRTYRAQRFSAVVMPLLEQAGYTEYGWQARLSQDTGINDSTISRLKNGKAIPEIDFLPALAQACGISLVELLARTGMFPRESLQPLSETDPSRVGSRPTTPDEVADIVGIRDEVGRHMLAATIERLKRLEGEEAAAEADENRGGAAAQM
jgi:transcriptional regulator with XRE-family HTH domain